ncbi:MAG: SRPBCC domain-containing protein [Deltaproteobacteria bacterium]|nr:SRPBCC domain-containing protein [Deltaproteobacteria bacterium]
MPVTNVVHDTERLSLTITAEFAAPIERIWALYADPRQLERVFGPPSHPATFVEHELRVGGVSKYFMTGPEGEKYHGVWTITAVDEPNAFSFEDGFADESFVVNQDMPVSQCTYSFEAIAAGTRATFVSTYASAEALQQVLDMGIVEGASSAINQIDSFLSAA